MRTEKVGRNDPCPCGSGRKYKKCCLGKDEGRSPEPEARAPGRDQAPRSKNARIAAALNRQIGAESYALSPYTIAKIVEDPRCAGNDEDLRKKIEEALRTGWTRKKVQAMTTDQIESQLRAYGVSHSKERFLRLAKDHDSAWSVSEEWMAADPIVCRGRDEDFLGLAACALWTRYLPERPSVEMIDDWMQEGYALSAQGNEVEACDIWWKVWCVLRSKLRPEVTTMEAAASVFNGTQSIFNWSQDFETGLHNAALRDARFFSIGSQYCAEWIAQFRDEADSMQVSFHRGLAEFVSGIGEPERAGAILHRIVRQWPKDVWGYVALADAYSRFFPIDFGLPLDLGKAIGCLEEALAIPGLRERDLETVKDRLAELRKRLGAGGRQTPR